MMNTSKQATSKGTVAFEKQRSYSEVIEFLDSRWSQELDKSLACLKKLDAVLGSPSSQLKTIHVAGTNGKSLTIDFITKLLQEEGIKVGSFYSPHILTYNERIALNGESIANKIFTELANEVINTAESLKLKAHASELLTAMALLHFQRSHVDVAVLEVSLNQVWDPVTICIPAILAITRVIWETEEENQELISKQLKEVTALAKKNCWVVSADQSKLNLQLMQDQVTALGAHWAMPIRKLATLTYPFEQLHGRCAALAERAAQLYLEKFAVTKDTIVNDSLLIKPKGTRGRPTLEAKRQLELNPTRTLEHFWKETATSLAGRFQLLDKEKPSILLDSASNIDAFCNLLLGIRLLHYQRPLKGLTLIIGCENNELNKPEFLKQVRYFFKKTSGQIIFCPIKASVYSNHTSEWDVEKITNDVKNVKVKAKSAKNFADAFEQAKKSVDERHGLVVITGSRSIIAEYWENKGIKRF